MTSTEVRRNMWFPLAALGVVVLGSVVATLVAPAMVPTGLPERFVSPPVMELKAVFGMDPTPSGFQFLSTDPLEVVPRAPHGYWLIAGAVAWFAVVAWYGWRARRGKSREWPWWKLAVLAVAAPLVCLVGLVFVVVDLPGFTAVTSVLVLGLLAGGYAWVSSGWGRWLGRMVSGALLVSAGLPLVSFVSPVDASVVFFCGAALVWFTRSVLAGVSVASAVAALAWLPGPTLPVVVSAAALLGAAIVSRHLRLWREFRRLHAWLPRRSTASTEARRGVWFPLMALAALMLGAVVELLVAPTLVPPAFGPVPPAFGEEDGYGYFMYVGDMSATGIHEESGVQVLSAAQHSSLMLGTSNEYWFYAAIVCWLVLLLWYRQKKPWWRVVAVGLGVPLVFVFSIACMAMAVESGEGWFTVLAWCLGLTVLAGGWAYLGQGHGRWLAAVVFAGLASSLALLGASDVLPSGAALLFVGGLALAWFARSGLVAVTTVVAVAALTWLPGPMLPAVAASCVLLLAALASRHPRLLRV